MLWNVLNNITSYSNKTNIWHIEANLTTAKTEYLARCGPVGYFIKHPFQKDVTISSRLQSPI